MTNAWLRPSGDDGNARFAGRPRLRPNPGFSHHISHSSLLCIVLVATTISSASHTTLPGASRLRQLRAEYTASALPVLKQIDLTNPCSPGTRLPRPSHARQTLKMATFDVEALLESTANGKNDESRNGRLSREPDDAPHSERRDRDRSSDRNGRRDRSPRRRDHSGERNGHGTPRSDAGSHRSGRRRSRSRDDDRPRNSRRYRGGDDHYSGRRRSRSRSPRRNHRYRDDRRDRRDDDRRRGRGTPKRDSTPQPTEDERDKRTVFVQQLAARLRTKELKEFFEKVGAVNEAQIVKDRISGRSKG